MLTEADARAAYAPKLRRRLTQSDVTCPAGTELGGCAVFCGIERHVIDEARESSSLMNYCVGDYGTCSTWRAEKERIAAGRTRALVDG